MNKFFVFLREGGYVGMVCSVYYVSVCYVCCMLRVLYVTCVVCFFHNKIILITANYALLLIIYNTPRFVVVITVCLPVSRLSTPPLPTGHAYRRSRNTTAAIVCA